MTTEQFAKAFGVTVAQVNDLRVKNRAQLESMYAKACETGRKVNGYTREQLRQLITGLDERIKGINFPAMVAGIKKTTRQSGSGA